LPKVFGSREFTQVAEADDAKTANIRNQPGDAGLCCSRGCSNCRTNTGYPARCEMAENIKQLQELKVQNEEILKQQQAALEALDEMQKEAEQLRIYSKRG